MLVAIEDAWRPVTNFNNVIGEKIAQNVNPRKRFHDVGLIF